MLSYAQATTFITILATIILTAAHLSYESDETSPHGLTLGISVVVMIVSIIWLNITIQRDENKPKASQNAPNETSTAFGMETPTLAPLLPKIKINKYKIIIPTIAILSCFLWFDNNGTPVDISTQKRNTLGAVLTRTRSTGVYSITITNELEKTRVFSVVGGGIDEDVSFGVGESKTFGLLQGYNIPRNGEIIIRYHNTTYQRFSWNDSK